MNIIWLGHGSFRIEIEDQVLLIDPWLSGNPVLEEDQHDAATQGATHILLTHTHFDHVIDVLPLAKKLGIPVVGQYDLMGYWAEKEGIETVGFNKGGTVELGAVTLGMVPASHSSTFQVEDGLRTGGSEAGFILKGEGKTLYLSGDTDIMADMDWIGDYYKPDIGILSAGGHFTMDMAGAAYAVKRYFPSMRTVIPCHYKTFPILAQDAQALIDGLPDRDVIEPKMMEAIAL